MIVTESRPDEQDYPGFIARIRRHSGSIQPNTTLLDAQNQGYLHATDKRMEGACPMNRYEGYACRVCVGLDTTLYVPLDAVGCHG